jgi:hypothetical protein
MAIGDLTLVGQILYVEVQGGNVTIGDYVKTTFAPGNVSNIIQIVIDNEAPVALQLGCNLSLPAISLMKL